MRRFYSIIIIFISIITTSCSHGELQVENNFKDGLIKNIEWGELPITDKLIQGENSLRKIDNNTYYNIKLPESYPIKFDLVTENGTFHFETKKVYTIEAGKYTYISLNEETEIIELFE